MTAEKNQAGIPILTCLKGQHSGVVFSAVVGLIPGLGLFCLEFACSPCFWLGSLQALSWASSTLYKNMDVRRNGNSKLSVHVNVNGCKSLFVLLCVPAVNWWLAHCVTCLLLMRAGIGSSRPLRPLVSAGVTWYRRWMHGWMDWHVFIIYFSMGGIPKTYCVEFILTLASLGSYNFKFCLFCFS